MDDRDMFYNSYGYGGFSPMTTMPGQLVPMMNQPYQTSTTMPSLNQMPNNTYTNSQFNDMNERINRLERQVKRLDQRLTRLETPYANTNMLNTEPDNNMYMM